MTSRGTFSPAIFGCVGLELTPQEIVFFQQIKPLGFILFARNIQEPAQVKALTESLRHCVSHEPLMLIDQEGGRVVRLKPPYWYAAPPPAHLAQIARRDVKAAAEALRLNYQIIGAELAVLGINVNCAPVLDLHIPGAHDIVGDRALGDAPQQVATLGRAVCEGLLEAGVLPVLKHIPGHGRAMADSHESLPVVDVPLDVLETEDFLPFWQLADMPLAMTAHITYTALDPAQPATLSPGVIACIREQIGFNGLLMTDDLSMKALRGNMEERARRSLQAGCDVLLHCNGEMAEMEAIARACTLVPPMLQTRYTQAMAMLPALPVTDIADIKTRLETIVREVA
ncbi:MAG: beta-N-acetylhexosaminidase [Rickettsiales bacterium]|nr:beta-N-acetylhexosaminidase [Rickettsiales bacterium]